MDKVLHPPAKAPKGSGTAKNSRPAHFVGATATPKNLGFPHMKNVKESSKGRVSGK